MPIHAINAHIKEGCDRRARVDQFLASMAETELIRAGEKMAISYRVDERSMQKPETHTCVIGR